MPVKSTSNHYGAVAITIHWLSATVILALLFTGFRLAEMANPASKLSLLQLHIPLGLTVFLLFLWRIFWWIFIDKKPASVQMPNWQDRLSRAVHFLFYVVVLGMVASGIGMIVLSEVGPAIFGNDPTVLPDFLNYKPRMPHGIGARVLAALILLHAGAAIYHQLVKKDGLLGRMWFGG